MTKFLTNNFGHKIEQIEILRESDSCVWLARSGGRERKALKSTSYEMYHDTWEAAHDHLVNRTLLKVRQCEASLEAAKAEMGKLCTMKAPVAEASK